MTGTGGAGSAGGAGTPIPVGGSARRATAVERFRLPAASAPWAEALAALRPDAASQAGAAALWPAGILDPDALAGRLATLAVDPADVAELTRAGELMAGDPGLREFAVRVATAFGRARAAADGAGDGSGPDLERQPGGWPGLASGRDVVDRWGWVVLHAAALPGLLRWYAEHGIDPDTAAATVADVGAQVAAYRRITGTGGVSTQRWLTLVASGRLLRVGRLQLEVRRLDAELAGAAGLPTGSGALAVHVPATGGPLAPDACDASFAAAPAMLARLHPGLDPQAFVCGSWLLDPGLATVLPASSNIRRFADRFSLLPRGPGERPGSDIRTFLFSAFPDTPVGELPRDSRLRRAVAEAMEAGRSWWTRTGWFLPAA